MNSFVPALWSPAMLALTGRAVSCCDGVSRRGFLKLGTLGLGGMTLADLLAQEG